MNAKGALDDALAQVATAKKDREVWYALLQERVAAAAAVQLDPLKKTEDEARAAAGNHPQVDDAVLESSRAAEEKAEAHLETVVGNLRKAEGALRGSGGAVADERAATSTLRFDAHTKSKERWRTSTRHGDFSATPSRRPSGLRQPTSVVCLHLIWLRVSKH